jgi:oligopeptide/dipeptide ABC transporter ATP-binding protein
MRPVARAPILEVRNLRKYFDVRQPLLGLRRKPAGQIKAVDDVSFQLERGEVLALVGESGCGKSTLARTLIGLETASAGEILFAGEHVGPKSRGAGTVLPGVDAGGPGSDEAVVLPHMSLKRLRQRAQMIFQDPYESLNPRSTVHEIVAEPLVVHGVSRNQEERRRRVTAALEEAGLRPAQDYEMRFPHELSGGQRQRVVIAAAMVLEPELLLADEPVSMLDVSIRAEILNLLNELRRKRGVSILFITHDLGTVAHFASRLAVMYLGRIVESGPAEQLLRDPRHPYTKALLSVVPVPNPRQRRERVILQGETPNAGNIPSGCRFHPRCPVAIDRCREEDPEMVSLGNGHHAACLLVAGAPLASGVARG